MVGRRGTGHATNLLGLVQKLGKWTEAMRILSSSFHGTETRVSSRSGKADYLESGLAGNTFQAILSFFCKPLLFSFVLCGQAEGGRGEHRN